ncbi:MAG: glycosyltransferase family 9 protein [Chitinophagaceae bacterium]|nr:glycosyltransferase family 9 protein [Chitinophagaceae bacterium]
MNKRKILVRVLSILVKDPGLTASLLGNVFKLFLLSLKSLSQGKRIIVVALTEHLGDVVATEPIVSFLKEKNPESILCWVIDRRYAAITRSNPAVDSTITVTSFSEWVLLKYFLSAKNSFDLHIDGKWCSKHGLVNKKQESFGITLDNYLQKGNLLYGFSRAGGIEMPAESPPTLHLKNDAVSLKDKYVVFHTSANNIVKEWNSGAWQSTAKFIIENYPRYHIIETGFKKNLDTPLERIVDMTGEKELDVLASLIRNADIFIGLDSGPAHMANALNKEAIVLMGTLDNFEEYMPFSGKFQREEKQVIVRHRGPLREMPFESVLDLLSKKFDSR